MKKILSALLALISVASLVACASDSGSTDDTATSSIAADTTASTADTAAEYVDPEMDFEGETFYIAAYDTDTASWKAATYCEAYVEEENGDPINDAIYMRNRAVEEELNIKIALCGFANSRNIAPDLQPLILADDDDLDMAYVLGNGIQTLIGTGNIIDLNKISTLDLSRSWWDEKSVESLRMLDANYAVTGDASLYSSFAPFLYLFNKQVAEDYSVGNLYDVVRDGKWTIDTAMETVRSVSADVNGDGVRGIEDVYGLCCEIISIRYALDSCGVRITKTNSDGIPELVFNNEKTASLIEKLVPFFSDRNYLTRDDYHIGYSNAFTDVLLPMFTDNRALFFNNQLLVTMNLRDMESDFGILPNPKYDESQDDYISYIATAWMTCVTVPATNRDLEMTGYVLDALGYYSQQYVTPAFIDTTVMNKALRDDDSAEMLNLILDSRDYDIAYFYNWGDIGMLAYYLLNSNSTDFASKYASVEDSVLAEIDETIELVSKNK